MKAIFVTISFWCLSVSLYANDNYFPQNSLGRRADLSEFVENWFSKQLVAMGEKPIFPSAKDKEIYRFTWLRTFHHPMVFRLDVLADGRGVLHSVENSGAGGYEPGVLLHSSTKEQTAVDLEELRQQLADMDYWNMQSRENKRLMTDGAEWIFEASVNGSYHFVVRQSPMGSKYYDTMLQFMRRSGMELGEIY